MTNLFLGERTAKDIDGQVAKVLRDLGRPNPPLCLDQVRDLLKLDRHYYRSDNDGVVREFIHHLMISGKQIVKNPMRIFEAVKKWDLRALYLPDRRRILIDASLPQIKQRWGEAHEIGHSITPWHEQYMLGDDKFTLQPVCHAKIEAEANYAAGRMLFLQDQFVVMLADSELNLEVVKSLAKLFGNTITSTLWRAVEHASTPAVGLIGVHPHYPGDNFDWVNPFRYFIRSKTFSEQYPGVSANALFQVLRQYCKFSTRGPLGAAEVAIVDANGDTQVFGFETFYNGHEALTLGIHRRSHVLAVAV